MQFQVKAMGRFHRLHGGGKSLWYVQAQLITVAAHHRSILHDDIQKLCSCLLLFCQIHAAKKGIIIIISIAEKESFVHNMDDNGFQTWKVQTWL